MTISKDKPLDSIRDGSLTTAIWANETETGTRLSVDLTRSYKDASDNWQTSRSLSGTELLQGSRLLAKAYDRYLELKKELS